MEIGIPLVSVFLVGMLGLIFRVYRELVRNPEKLRSALRKQGIHGPPPTVVLGNVLEIKKARTTKPPPSPTCSAAPKYHNCANAVLPFFGPWKNKYGDLFVFSIGMTPILHVSKHDMVREMTTCTSLDLGKPAYLARDRASLLGKGILTSNATLWARQRKIIAPELNLEHVKGMINMIQESAMSLVDAWSKIVEAKGCGIAADIKIDEYMRSFSGDVISKACFGSNYSKGEQIFLKLRALQECASKRDFSFGIPFVKYLPTKSNREAWALDKDVRRLILEVVKERVGSSGDYVKDLLQRVLEGAKNDEFSPEEIDHFIVDNCKNIYLAGYETTSVAATWCLMLLAANPEWQEHVRAEVLATCQGQVPDGDSIRKMKLLNMVINEALRLYPPVVIISREVYKEMTIGDICTPKGLNLWAPVLTLHTDPEVWGADSYEFNPARFANGITGACKHPHLYMPFGVGPRVCLGQHLALVELKILLSVILSKFSVTLSASYIHSPIVRLIIEPEHGVDLYVKKL